VCVCVCVCVCVRIVRGEEYRPLWSIIVLHYGL
jgi:hypothetical protein